MSVLCGRCKQHHATPAEVKACYAGNPAAASTTAAAKASDGLTFGNPLVGNAPRASEKQLDFLMSLLKERTYGGDAGNQSCADLLMEAQGFTKEIELRHNLFTHLDRRAVSKQIEAHMTLDKVKAPVSDTSWHNVDVPAGYYATPSMTGNNDLDFWRVDVPEKGKWAGYRFVKRVIGGQGAVNISKAERFNALQQIDAIGAQAAGKAYADAIGCCYRCNRELTDETSRAVGLGPVCRNL